jgi:EAL domain-containing protein (putative c-di-GMP-specific phosphodiesterase class I)
MQLLVRLCRSVRARDIANEQNGRVNGEGKIVCHGRLRASGGIARDVASTAVMNVSWVEIRQADFVGKVLAAVGGPLNAAALLDLEITESGLTEDVPSVRDKLTQLHDLGVGIIMDDFGTGASSLSQLAQLPVDVVKIDRSLVAEMVERPRALAIVSAIVGLAKALGIVALAEGVETETVAQHLQQLGCQRGQGFLFSAPLSAGELAKLLPPAAGASVAAG